ncbi:M3 family metallopeptidase [Yimella sp. cx-51]|uniref:M3 family metallopeptidase n=1 Tax=Yimella sp. cx-51 TaxID=2770551 RepID=UPI00165D944C|nr:M3 family metallopeptidase [Yimella sp. cx-51]MBC9956737.1 Zn-dependent oligopeptidase [Yimella sp. cx-51]QTH38973.1 Zn-dependent oligopeptidase [Yimella sp. cx-51]
MTPTPLALPAHDALEWLTDRCDGGLDDARSLVERLKQGPVTDVLATWNAVQIELGNAAAAASLFSEVHPDAAVREAADEAMQRVDAYSTELGLDSELFAVLDAAHPGDDTDAQRLLELTRRDFRRAGVDKSEADRERLRELAQEELKAGQEFGKNIREGTRLITVRPEQLAGMPQDWIDAHPAGDGGQVTVTTDYPDSVPLMTFCADRSVREAMVRERQNIAWPANDAVLQRLFALRQEHAELLGYDNWADFDAEVKMIGDGKEIRTFIDKITEAATERALADKQVLLDRLHQDHPDVEDVTAVDTTYYSEVVRKEQHDVDAQLTRTYFRFDNVRQGLLDVTGRLFGLEWRAVPDAPVWHQEVTGYDVLKDGERIGRIYLDLHPREGKFKHAAQFTLVSGVDGVQLPEGVLVCNFSRGLMEHDEVVTLFHEFGHLVHHVVGGQQQKWSRFSGVATEWDFVEAPSQMLEEWAWDASVLASFATNDKGEPIPADLVARMKEADEFGKGFLARTQMFYAAVSVGLHVDRPRDITEYLQQTQRTYSVFPPLPDSHFHCSFGHLDGYSSGYYTYMWSLVIAKDMFSAFDEHDLFAPEVATRYRDRVLGMGGRKDAADLVEDFLGRPYTFDAYAEWLAK